MLSSKNGLNFIEGVRLWRYWSYRALVSYRIRFRGSRMGQLWPTLSLLTLILVIGSVWGVILGKQNLIEYFIYLACGYPIWTIISGTVEQGCRDVNVTIAGGKPVITVIFERSVLAMLPFLYTLPIIVVAVVLYHQTTLPNLLLFPLLSAIMVFWVFGLIAFLIAMISTIPDLKHVVLAVMRLAFLATPIIWEAERLGEYQKYIWLNPFYIPLESLRSSLISTVDPNYTLFLYFGFTATTVFMLGIIGLRLRITSLSG